jgi:hypothetical protein
LISGPYQFCQNEGLALDQRDNIYFAANFTSQLLMIGNQTLTNRSAMAGSGGGGAGNGFLAKFSKAGDCLWARQIGGTGSDGTAGCATDANGNVFVTGGFSSTNVVLGGAVLTNPMPEAACCFLAKYDPQGNLLWARQSLFGDGPEPGGTIVMGLSVAVDAGGNVWLAGAFDSSNVVFGTNVLVNTGNSGFSSTAGDFLVKYDGAGNVLWAKTITVNASVFNSPSIGLDTNGNAFFSDAFYGIANLGTTMVTNASGGNQSLLLAKFDPAGNLLWAEQAAYPVTSGGGLTVGAVAVDPQGNCRMAGSYFSSAAVFPSNTLPAPAGYEENGFVAKFDASGSFLWASAVPGEFRGCGALDAVGNTYSVGYDFGSNNIVMCKYGGDGILLWRTNSSGPYDLVLGTVDPAGSLFVAGGASNDGDGFVATRLSGPTLNIQPLGNQIVVSWPTNEAGLGLESAPGLFGLWLAVTNPAPAIIGNQYVVTNAVPVGSEYFRLGNY